MKTPPPLRHYNQMTRIVRTAGFPAPPYKLAKAYGEGQASANETRQRSLDETGINSRSSRQSSAPDLNNYYDTRESSSLFYQLDTDQKMYFTGTAPDKAPTRQDAISGTKSRNYLGGNISAQKILVQDGNSDKTDRQDDATEHAHQHSKYQSHAQRQKQTPNTPEPSAHKSASLNYMAVPQAGKQTRKPETESDLLNGINSVSIDFTLK